MVAMKLKTLLGRKAVTNSVLKSKDITLLTKVRIMKAMVFPAVLYGCELDIKAELSSQSIVNRKQP